MNEEPKACSSCGKQPQGNNWHTYGKNPKDEMRYFCANHDCPNALKKALTLDEWNTRPLEDALRAELAAKNAEIERLRDALQECKPIPVSERMPEAQLDVQIFDGLQERWTIGFLVKLAENRYQWSLETGIYWHDDNFARITHWMPLPEPPE